MARSIRLDISYECAKEQLEMCLGDNALICFTHVGNPLKKVGNLQFKSITSACEDDSANIYVEIGYILRDMQAKGGLINLNKQRKLLFLSNISDIKWNKVLIDKVWNGNYPSGVAIDCDDGEVFLVYIYNSILELCSFNVLDKADLLYIKDLDYSSPYEIKIIEEAMFNVLAEDEGNRHLRENVAIQFNMGRKIILKRRTNLLGDIYSQI